MVGRNELNTLAGNEHLMTTIGVEERGIRRPVLRVVDEIDSQILSILRDNARTKNVEIARRVNLTEGGVRARIAKMLKDGVIEKFTVLTRSNDVLGLVLIKTQLDQTRVVAKRLKELATSTYETSGEFDLASELRADTLELFNRKVDEIRSFPGVVDTMTLIRMT